MTGWLESLGRGKMQLTYHGLFHVDGVCFGILVCNGSNKRLVADNRALSVEDEYISRLMVVLDGRLVAYIEVWLIALGRLLLGSHVVLVGALHGEWVTGEALAGMVLGMQMVEGLQSVLRKLVRRLQGKMLKLDVLAGELEMRATR